MAIVSDLEIRLFASIARLQQDMTQARSTVEGAMNHIGRAVGTAQKALGALGVALSVGAFAGFIKGAIDATDKASDLSQKTGVAIKDLAGLQLAFQIGGTEGDAFATSMVKLSKGMDEGSKGLIRLGIRATTASGALKSNKDVLYEVADAFQGLQNDTQRTALAVEIFGKTGADLVPMLVGGSEGLREMAAMADKLGLTFDEKTVDAAGKFNDTLDFMKLGAQGVARGVAAQLLPTLNALAGSFLESMTSGDRLATTARLIGNVLKGLYTIAVGTVEVFSTLGKTLGAGAAAEIAFIQGDFKGAWQITKEWAADISSDWSATAKTISTAWDESGNATVEALAKATKATKVMSTEQLKAMEEAQKAAAAAAKKAQDDADNWYKKSMEDGRVAIQISMLALDSQAALTKEQENSIKVLGELVKHSANLTAERKAAVTAVLEERLRLERLTLAREADRKALDDHMAASKKDTDEAWQRVATLKEQVTQYGLTEDAVSRLKVAEYDRQLQAVELDEIETARLESLRAAMVEQIGLQRQLLAKDMNKSFWTDLEKTAHDTFISIADGGKGAAQRIKDTFKNVFFDWLYQQTLKKWVFNFSATSGNGSAAGAFFGGSDSGGSTSAATWVSAGKTIYEGFSKGFSTIGSSLGGVISQMGDMFGSSAVSSFGAGMGMTSSQASAAAGAYNSAGMAGTGSSIQAGSTVGSAAGIAAGIAGGVYGGRAVSGGFSAFGGGSGNSAVNTGTAVGAVVGSIVPVIGTALGALVGGLLGGAVNRLFGYKQKEVTRQGLTGQFGDGGFANGQAFQDWKQKGGWFRSDKSGTDTTAMAPELMEALSGGFTAMKSATADFAGTLGVSADVLTGYSKSLNLELTKDDAKNKELLAKLFTDIGDELALRVLPSIAQLAREGETASVTLQRLAGDFKVVDAMLVTLGTTSQQAFGAVGVASLEARERLINFAGGVDALATQTGFFADNFLTKAEQIAPLQKQVNARLAELGFAGITTADQFKAAVMGLTTSGALATEAGAKTYTGLLALAPAFKTVADYLVEIQPAAEDTAAALAAVVKGLQDAAGTAFAALQRAVDAQKAAAGKAFDALMSGIGESIDRVTGRISDLKSLSSALAGARTGNATDQQVEANRRSGQAQIAAALAIARASGVLPSADSLKDALASVSGDAASQFATFEEYQRDQLRTANNIEELSGLTDHQLSVAATTLQVLQDQKTAAQVAYDAEVTRLDALVASAQAQLDAVNGVNTSVLGVTAALAAFSASISAALGNRTIAAQSTVTPAAQLEHLYNSTLGRASDTSGMAYWSDLLAHGTKMSEVEAAFRNSPEYLARQASIYAPQQSSTMGGNSAMVAELQTLNSEVSQLKTAMNTTAASTSQFAQQFHTVSAGGNALLMETAPA